MVPTVKMHSLPGIAAQAMSGAHAWSAMALSSCMAEAHLYRPGTKGWRYLVVVCCCGMGSIISKMHGMPTVYLLDNHNVGYPVLVTVL